MTLHLRQPLLPVSGYTVDDRGYALGNSPLPASPTTKLGEDGAKLFARAETLTGRLQETKDAALAAGKRLEAAQQALTNEVTRRAVEGDRNDTRERELIAEVQNAEIDADAGILQHRFRAVLAAQQEAVTAAQKFLYDNLTELIETEYRPLAETVWAELENAEAGDSRSALEAARAAYDDVRRKIGQLAPWAFDKQAFVVPTEGLPLPPAESYIRPEGLAVPGFKAPRWRG